jgi:hypothetical protein
MAEEDDQGYRRLVETFSVGCSRLVQLLRWDGQKQDRLREYISEMINEAIESVVEEFGLDE